MSSLNDRFAQYAPPSATALSTDDATASRSSPPSYATALLVAALLGCVVVASIKYDLVGQVQAAMMQSGERSEQEKRKGTVVSDDVLFNIF